MNNFYAFIIPKSKVNKSSRTSDCLSVFTGEMFAIIMAIKWISEVKVPKISVPVIGQRYQRKAFVSNSVNSG